MATSGEETVRILAIAPYEAMAAALERCAESFPGVRLEAFTGDLQEGLDVLSSLDLSQYDAVLSRGGTADLLQGAAQLPVVEIPVQVYDILRTIKLAESYADRLAIIGFPGVTENAHTLCNLLGLKIRIETVHSAGEIPAVLEGLRRQQIHTVICDVASHRSARAEGFQALLITSGENSLHQAIESAERQGRIFRAIQDETTLLRTLLRQNLQQCVVLNGERDVVYSFARNLPEEILAAMRRRVSAVPENRELLFYHQEGGTMHAITASRFQLRGRPHFLFRDQPAEIPLRSAQSGIRIYDAAECEQLFSGGFITLGGSMGELEQRIASLASLTQPLLIIGEEGTGREQVARALYLQSERKNHPFVVVDGARINDRSWSYLMEHHASPLGANRTTVFFHHTEELPPQRQRELLSLIEETGLARRLWLLFASGVGENNCRPSFVRDLSTLLGPLTLHLPALRERRDEIPALAGLYLANLNMELGKQIAGLEPAALEMLVRYDWPGNYTQFKHVLQQAAVMTRGLYISGEDTADLLAGERSLYRKPPEAAGSFLAENLTLEEITRRVVEQALADNGGNQSLTARRLGISRSTLWRMVGKDHGRQPIAEG